MGLKTFKSNYPIQSPNTCSLRKSNVENCLVLSIAVLKLQRKCILTVQTFSRILSWTRWHWRSHVCKTQQFATQTQKNADFQFQAWTRPSYHTSFVVLSGKKCYSKRRFSVSPIHSSALLWDICSECCWCPPRKKSEQGVNNRCGDKEADWKQFVWLSDYGPLSTYEYQLCERISAGPIY